jgi:thiamine biosynthesis lipoprotein ApbE
MRRFAIALAVAGLLLAPLSRAHAASAPVRMAGTAFDRPAEIEVRDLAPAAAQSAIREAFVELDRSRAALRRIETAAADGRPLILEPAEDALVRRSAGFCLWSEGAVSPLGGEIFRLFGLRTPVAALPAPDEIDRAVAAARCERLNYVEASRQLTVAAGSRLDFFPFEIGWAVDRAAESLSRAGAANFWIEVGPILRGAGAGPDGQGWKVIPPSFPGLVEPLATFYLRDRTAALLNFEDHPLRIAGDRFSPYIDLRRARPGSGLLAVFVVAELGVDAQGVGYAMFALGPRDGTMLFGTLTPRPSVRWVLGTGAGPPVLTDVNWSIVPRR